MEKMMNGIISNTKLNINQLYGLLIYSISYCLQQVLIVLQKYSQFKMEL